MKLCTTCGAIFASEGWQCPDCGNSPPVVPYVRLSDDLAELEAWDADEKLRAAAAEADSFWAKRRNELLVWVVSTYFPNAKTLFEAGCGTGIVLRALDEALSMRLVGGDAYRPALEAARAVLPDVELLQIDLRKLPFDSEFDVALCVDVLEHIDDDRLALRELRRALQPGGGLVLTVPQHPWLWSAADEWDLHHRRYRRRDLCQRVREAGFDLLRVSSFVSLLLPLMAAARITSRCRPHYDPAAELQLPRRLQDAFSAVMSVELALIRRGIDFPAGGSLLLVAKRR